LLSDFLAAFSAAAFSLAAFFSAAAYSFAAFFSAASLFFFSAGVSATSSYFTSCYFGSSAGASSVFSAFFLSLDLEVYLLFFLSVLASAAGWASSPTSPSI